MVEIIKNIQLILISKINEDSELCNKYVENLKVENLKVENFNSNIDIIKDVLEILTKFKLYKEDVQKIAENEIIKLRTLFQIENLRSYEYEQTMALLFNLIGVIKKNELDNDIYKTLSNNLAEYFDSEEYPIASFSSLYLLLYYLYKKKYKDNYLDDFEKKYNIEKFVDGYIENRIEGPDKNIFDYLKKFMNDDRRLYKTESFHICHNLNIGLSLTKMIEFAFYNVSIFEKIDNLVLFIGATRAGKSTLINYLDGVEYELLEDDEETLVPKEKQGNYNKLKCAGQYSTSSQTLYSEVIKIVKDNQVYHFADLPGFFDKNTAKNKSILAALGLPILIQKAENIKAIVVVLEYKIFSTTAGDVGRDFEKISKHITQLFKRNFENNTNTLNILFAITKPPYYRAGFSVEKVLNLVRKSLNNFKACIEDQNYLSILTEHTTNIPEFEDKIALHDLLIETLEKNKSEQTSSNVLDKITKYFSNIKIFNRKNHEDKTKHEDSIDRLEGQFKSDYENAIRNNELIDLTLQKWKTSKKEITNLKDNANKFINEYNAQKLMIDLLINALNNKNVFIFKCFKETNDKESDDKHNLIDKIKRLNDKIKKDEFFKFDGNHEFFKSVEERCVQIVKEANLKYKDLKENFTKINKNDNDIARTQELILLREREINKYLKSVDLNVILIDDYSALNIYRNYNEHLESLISNYEDSIEEEKLKIKTFSTMSKQIISKQQKFPRFWFNRWSFKYTEDVKIEKVILSFLNFDKSECLKSYDLRKGTDENLSESIPYIGKFLILEYNRQSFEFRFKANREFNGFVDVKVFVLGKYLPEYKQLKIEIEQEIEQLESLKQEEKKQLKKNNIEIKTEEHRIQTKIRILKNGKKIDKFEAIKTPLYDLCYDKHKFIKYLLEEKKIESTYETISKIFESFDDEAKSTTIEDRNQIEQEAFGIYFDEDGNIQNLMKKINYLSDTQIKVLVKILSEIGFAISTFQLLVNYLKEITKSLNDMKTIPLIKERDKHIEERKQNLQKLNEFKKKITELQNLKTYDQISKILDFKISSESCFNELSKYREFVKENQIFEKKFEMKLLADTLKNFTDVLEMTFESSPPITNLDLDIIDDLELKDLYQNDMRKKTKIIQKLKEINDEVRCFYNNCQLSIFYTL
jgi:hypothetical protein